MKMRKIIAVMAAALMLLSILPMAVFAADTYELASSIAAGDTVVLACTSKKMELNGISTTSTKYGLGVAYTTAPAGAYVLTVEAGYTAGTYSFKCPNGQYLYWTSGNSLATNATKNANTSWTVTFSGDNAVIKNAKDTARQLQWNASSPRFACYGNSGQTAVQLFKKVSAAAPECEHAWDNDCDTECNLGCGETREPQHNYVADIIDATCTATGSAAYECSVCGSSYDEVLPMIPHNFVDGYCSVCNEPQPLEATITFDNLSKMTSSSTTQQVWEENGIVVTYDKNTYNNNLVEYANPVRFYAGTKVTIAYPGITKIEIVANNTSYATVVSNALSGSTVSGTTITYIPDEATDSVSFVPSAQTRVNSITVYGSSPSACEHDYVGVETQAPTCTVEGVMTYTCSKCEDSYIKPIAVIPHDYVEDIIDSTCTETGTKTFECSVCFHSYDETIPVKNHNYVDDICDACGHVKVYKGTITFDADKTQRVEYSTQIQVWENEGLTFTNNKLTGNNIGDYGAPVRIYKNSGIIIEFSEMSKLIIDAANVGNDYLWDATLDAAELAYTVDGGIYTITFAEPVNSVELTCANQIRANSITAVVAHECAYDDAFDVDCNKCGAIREVETLIFNGKSASEDVVGLAFLFSMKAEGIEIHENTQNTFKAESGEVDIDGVKYTLKYAGAVVTNKELAAEELTIANAQNNGNKTIKNIGAKYLWNFSAESFKYAIRIINIPEANWDTVISARPYFIYADAEGNSVVIYGEVQTGTYNGTIG